MNGLMNKYKKSLAHTPKPILPSQISNTVIDLKGLLLYAKSKNVSPASLSKQEKERFIVRK